MHRLQDPRGNQGKAGTRLIDGAGCYRGRFAPSPTGPLHFGSLLAALASYLDARAHGGRWLLRIDDIDPPREMPGASALIMRGLREHGLFWDEPPLFQSRRLPAYRSALQRLSGAQRLFYCRCSRRQLADCGPVYPGHCRNQRTPPRAGNVAVRLRVTAASLCFDDLLLGRQHAAPLQQIGDFVIWRRDDLPAYQLACALDDAWQGISHVIRGEDLLESTPRQLLLMSALGLPLPRYGHLPLVVGSDGQKLSKQNGARALDAQRARQSLLDALELLGQPRPPARLHGRVRSILEWGTEHWQRAAVPHGSVFCPGLSDALG